MVVTTLILSIFISSSLDHSPALQISVFNYEMEIYFTCIFHRHLLPVSLVSSSLTCPHLPFTYFLLPFKSPNYSIRSNLAVTIM